MEDPQDNAKEDFHRVPPTTSAWDDLIRLWIESGPTGKLLLLLSCLGTSTLLTSLTSTLIEWNALISSMLNFYWDCIRGPITTIARTLTLGRLELSARLVDAALLYATFVAANKRVVGALSERSALVSSLFLSFVVLLPILLIILFYGVGYLLGPFLGYDAVFAAELCSVGVPIGLIVHSLLEHGMELRRLARGEYPEGLTIDSRPLYYRWARMDALRFAAPLFLSFVILAVLASVDRALQ